MGANGLGRKYFVFAAPIVFPRRVNWPQECAVVIPCRNEARFIAPLVREVRSRLPNVIVVDDASSDTTARDAKEAGAIVVSHSAPSGKGVALQTGWRRARESGFAWVLCMDGDGQHAPADIGKFLECAERTGASLVVGNRMSDASKMPWLRRLVNRWMSRKLSALAGQELPDSQCGYRLVRLAALERLRLSATQFEIESEQLLAFIEAGERVEFVPVQVIYRSERSKIHPWRDTWRWLRWRREWLESSARRESSANRNTK
jgi:glycosyltransferase involved in cell wall biosynthesis